MFVSWKPSFMIIVVIIIIIIIIIIITNDIGKSKL